MSSAVSSPSKIQRSELHSHRNIPGSLTSARHILNQAHRLICHQQCLLHQRYRSLSFTPTVQPWQSHQCSTHSSFLFNSMSVVTLHSSMPVVASRASVMIWKLFWLSSIHSIHSIHSSVSVAIPEACSSVVTFEARVVIQEIVQVRIVSTLSSFFNSFLFSSFSSTFYS